MKKPKLSFPRELLELAMDAGGVEAWYWNVEEPNSEIIRTENYDRVLGYTSKPNHDLRELLTHVHPKDRPLFSERISDLVSGRVDAVDFEYRVNGDDGRVRWIRSHGKAFRGPNGKVERIAGVTTDVTEVRSLQEARDRVVAALSHDLRNPLAAAKANAELISRLPASVSKEKDLLRRVVKGIERADRIIQDLLDVSRIRSRQPIPMLFQNCDLREVVQDTCRDLSLQYGDRFRLEMNGDLVGSWATDIIRRVLENLANNAVKYGALDRPIGIRVERQGEEIAISVHNEGNPIPADEQEHLYEFYFRSASARKSGLSGTGLGLTFVKGAAEALHGRVSVASTMESGTTFTFEFPAAQSDVRAA